MIGDNSDFRSVKFH